MASMNQAQPYMDVHSHLSSAQPYASHAATTGAMAHYQYPQQPPVLQPTSTYPPASSYSQYPYPNGVASSGPPSTMGAQMPAQILPLPVSNHPVAHTYANTTGAPAQGHVYDPSGQLAPPGAKPRVTATLWEDEGSLCYQVEAKGVCVARRDDNGMINGTKLLNVAGMTRGRRDGILKSEKTRTVVKIGPMHLKGVWIPYDRALEFANKEKITDLLYPLFVTRIGELLYHPANSNRTNLVAQHSEHHRRLEAPQTARTPQTTPASLHHHHSLQTPVPAHMSQPGGRPSIDRAHTFPTPPASASSLIGITSQGNSYEWNQGMNSSVSNSQPLSIDTSLNNARSMPTTPATTPPGSNMHGMPSYPTQSGYDAKPYYSAAPSAHPHYASQSIPQQPMAPYGHSMPTSSYRDMAPPSHRGSVGHADAEPEVKREGYAQSSAPVGGTEPEQEAEYVQPDSGYSTGRGSYYTTNPSVGGLAGEHSQLTPDMTGSPHQNGSGRMTPRTSGAAPQWAPGYSTPPRPAAASSLYNLVSDTRGTSGANGTSDNYSVASNSYSTGLNGSLGSNKRMREDDDDHISRPNSRAEYDGKRRKTLTETVGGPVGGVPLGLPMKAGGSLMAGRR
ncbi:cell pattern formation-associated protein stuA [Aspergillus unguis]